MDSDSWIRIILLAFLTMGAAYCAASEISYAAMNNIRMKNYAENGDRRAKTAIYISENFEQALTTLLIGNNIMHIGFGSLTTLLATQLWGVKSVKYTTIISAIYVFLVSEMIPKSYAKANSEKFAMSVSGSLRILMKVLSPVTFLFMSLAKKLSKIFPSSTEDNSITEEEFYDIIETVEEEGVLDKEKQQLVHSALSFDVKTAGEIMIPREKIVALNVNTKQDEILKIIKTKKYSRIPVYKDSVDNIIGILHVRKFLKAYIKHEAFDIYSLLTEFHIVNKNAPIDDLLREMSSKKLHMSIITDNNGKTLGIVTVEDILEELVGEIWDENDVVSEKTVRVANSASRQENRYMIADSQFVITNQLTMVE